MVRPAEPEGVSLRAPVIFLILAATAIPVELRPLTGVTLDATFAVTDAVANVIGYLPVGVVLAQYGILRAVLAALLMSATAESCQFVMMHRYPSLVDVATNVTGALLGATAGTIVRLPIRIRVTRYMAIAALAIVMYLFAGVAR